MQEYLEQFTQLFIPENLIKLGGLSLVLFIVFAETGLFIGFFLPGDSLLFTAGILCSTHVLDVNIWTLMLGLNIAAILGNITGYYFGRRIGPKLFTREDSFIFKKRYVLITQAFYERHGGKALIIGRFLPIIRTFAPILSGVIELKFKSFLFFSVVGSVLWTSAMTSKRILSGQGHSWLRKSYWIGCACANCTYCDSGNHDLYQRDETS
jgi:membrane-associated protein